MMSAKRPSPVIGMFDAPMWEFMKKDEFRLQKCTSCATFRFIPASHCPGCMSGEFEWALMSGRGSIASWCVFHRQYFPEFPTPHLVLMVKTDEGPIVVGNLVDGKIENLKLDRKVQAVFEDVEWEDGSGGKILLWRLVS